MTAAAPQSTRLWRFAPRYSLRALLMALTAVAIGFPIWYRWPYVEVEVKKGTPSIGFTERRTHTTWQRQWGGGRLKHGTESVSEDGRASGITTYRLGKKHGPANSSWSNGGLADTGYYTNDLKDGIWTLYRPDGSVEMTLTYQRGTIDGPGSIHADSESCPLLFVAGRLARVNDHSIENWLAPSIATLQTDSPGLNELLKSELGMESHGLPLTSVAEDISKFFSVPVWIDQRHVDPNMKVSFYGRGINFFSSIALLMAQNDLGCDCRYGSIWITSLKDLKDWNDPTGITSIVPPKHSQLADSLNTSVNVSAIEQPLGTVLNQLAAPLVIDLDVSRVAGKSGEVPAYPVTLMVHEHPLRHVLGLLLNQANCKCRLEGETLVILPPE